jgi:membrane-associated phospholipid phosphatase
MPVSSPTSTHREKLLLALCLLAFAALAADLRWRGPITSADSGISSWFHANAQPAFTAFMTAVSALHSPSGICLAALCAAAWLAWRRQWKWLPLLVLCVPCGLVFNWLVKQAFQRARPAFDAASTLASYSFPSGHTAGATVWWGFVLVWWFAREPRAGPRAAAAVLAATMVLLTGLSRVYLGMHYLSDVLAAVAEAVAWLVLCSAAARVTRPARGIREPAA